MARSKRPASRAGLKANERKRIVNNGAITRYVFGPSATIPPTPPTPSAPVVRHAIFSEPEQGISIHMLRLVVDLEHGLAYNGEANEAAQVCLYMD